MKETMNKILVKAKQNPLAVGAIILVIVIAIMGYQCGVSKEAMRTAKIFEKQAVDARKKSDKITEEKEAENKKLEADNKEKDKVIAKTKAENKVLVRRRAEDRRLLEELKGEIAKERPVELVNRARVVLNTDEIWWNQETERAELSLSAFRNGVTKWAEWEDFTLKREPGYLQQIANDAIIIVELNGKIVNLGTEIGNLKIIIKTKDESYGSLKVGFDELKRVIGKNPGLLVKAFYGLLGFAGGVVFGN